MGFFKCFKVKYCLLIIFPIFVISVYAPPAPPDTDNRIVYDKLLSQPNVCPGSTELFNVHCAGDLIKDTFCLAAIDYTNQLCDIKFDFASLPKDGVANCPFSNFAKRENDVKDELLEQLKSKETCVEICKKNAKKCFYLSILNKELMRKPDPNTNNKQNLPVVQNKDDTESEVNLAITPPPAKVNIAQPAPPAGNVDSGKPAPPAGNVEQVKPPPPASISKPAQSAPPAVNVKPAEPNITKDQDQKSTNLESTVPHLSDKDDEQLKKTLDDTNVDDSVLTNMESPDGNADVFPQSDHNPNPNMEDQDDDDAEVIEEDTAPQQEPNPIKSNTMIETTHIQHSKQIGSGDFDGAEDSHFFVYFLTFTCFTVVGYIAFHNKNKILALALEGRRGRPSRRRPNSASYRKLDSLEEAMMAHPSHASTTHPTTNL